MLSSRRCWRRYNHRVKRIENLNIACYDSTNKMDKYGVGIMGILKSIISNLQGGHLLWVWWRDLESRILEF